MPHSRRYNILSGMIIARNVAPYVVKQKRHRTVINNDRRAPRTFTIRNQRTTLLSPREGCNSRPRAKRQRIQEIQFQGGNQGKVRDEEGNQYKESDDEDHGKKGNNDKDHNEEGSQYNLKVTTHRSHFNNNRIRTRNRTTRRNPRTTNMRLPRHHTRDHDNLTPMDTITNGDSNNGTIFNRASGNDILTQALRSFLLGLGLCAGVGRSTGYLTSFLNNTLMKTIITVLMAPGSKPRFHRSVHSVTGGNAHGLGGRVSGVRYSYGNLSYSYSGSRWAKPPRRE